MKKKLSDAELKKIREIDAYDHIEKSRPNIPPVGMAKYDDEPEQIKTYSFDPHLDPSLEWSSKAENQTFQVKTSSIHQIEIINPSKILHSIQKYQSEDQSAYISLFDSEFDRLLSRQSALEFYQHDQKWTNRLIAGDSLVVMNSLLEKESLSRQVQMIYFDPPYGIKYGSNFQPFINKRDVKDRNDDDLSQEPETIKAFRDTWELGIHSYLNYLRNRLLLSRELLTDSGSIFVQISDENVHLVRCLCDEVFGRENFVAMINFRKKTMPLGAKYIEQMCDYILFYAKDINKLKYRHIFKPMITQGDSHWNVAEFEDGTRRKLTVEEVNNYSLVDKDFIPCRLVNMSPIGYSPDRDFEIELNGKKFIPAKGKSWKTDRQGIERLKKFNRLVHFDEGNKLNYLLKRSDYPITVITANWDDASAPTNMQYVVQTSTKVIQRCMLMTTDVDDLVLDITCGSGTTAFVAEQFGRRWITCDTSRVAIEIAKTRLMTAAFDYYKLADESKGISGGFIYKKVPHITLKSIANDEKPEDETLFDQPEVDKKKIRIAGPFSVESLPAPMVMTVDEAIHFDDDTSKQSDWREELLASGIIGKSGDKMNFTRVETLEGTKYLQSIAETDDGKSAVIYFGSDDRELDSRTVNFILDEAETIRPKPNYIIFAAFQFSAEAAAMIDQTKWLNVNLLKVQMNTDLMTDDLKKKQTSNQSFWLVGQPDVELISCGDNRYKVRVIGYDYYDVNTNKVESGNADKIAMWLLDTNYNGKQLDPCQVFFPLNGFGGWNKLAKTLKTEIDPELLEKFSGNESLEFTAEVDQKIAVKIIDDRGIESIRILVIGNL